MAVEPHCFICHCGWSKNWIHVLAGKDDLGSFVWWTEGLENWNVCGMLIVIKLLLIESFHTVLWFLQVCFQLCLSLSLTKLCYYYHFKVSQILWHSKIFTIILKFYFWEKLLRNIIRISKIWKSYQSISYVFFLFVVSVVI